MFTVQGFNSEITEELSTMSELKRTEKEIPTTSDGPQIFFTTSNQSTDQEACESPKVESGPYDSPKIESSPTDSTPSSSWGQLWLMALITFVCATAASMSEGVCQLQVYQFRGNVFHHQSAAGGAISYKVFYRPIQPYFRFFWWWIHTAWCLYCKSHSDCCRSVSVRCSSCKRRT